VLAVGASVVYHTALGLALAALVWLVGLGVLGRLRGGTASPRSLTDAYPLGLIGVMVAALPPLLWRPLGLLSLGVLAFLAWGSRLRLPVVPARAWLFAVAGSAGFGLGLGALLHGPTDELDSAAYGGMLFYVDKVVSAGQSIAPFHDLLVAGQRIIYAEAGTSFVGAALDLMPGFDPVLYNAATLPAFALASVCAGFAAFAAERPRTLDGRTAAAVALLALGIVVYPTWLTETPPAAFALPLAFSLHRIWRDPISPLWLATLGAVIAFDFLFTKVLGVVPLGLLLVAAVVERTHRRPDFRRLVAIGTALLTLGAGAVIALLFLTAGWYASLLDPKALPLDVARAVRDGDVNPRTLGLSALIVGDVLLLAALVRRRWFAIAAAVGLVVPVVWFVAGYAFDIALGTAVFVAALELRRNGSADRLLLAAAALIALSVPLRDVLGARPGLALALLALIGLLPFVGARAGHVMTTAAGAAAACLLALADLALLGLAGLAVVAIAAVVSARFVRVAVPVLGAVAVVAAAVSLALGRLAVGTPGVTLTPDDHDIWSVVGERVPSDALVFTTLTGRDVTPQAGWNNYPSIAGRQLYIAGWYDGRLVSAPDERDERLALNRAVLTGRRRPDEVNGSRGFDSYYAVTRVREQVPTSFRRAYENESYALYEIP
jgi:hypothetical protein